MKKETKAAPESQLLELLKQVLPKATNDPSLAGRIYQAVEHELQAKARTAAFERLCARMALPNLEAASLAEVKSQLATSFGEGDVNASILFVGEGPGQEEDRLGRPFVGAAGKLLDEMLSEIGFKRNQVFIANKEHLYPSI